MNKPINFIPGEVVYEKMMEIKSKRGIGTTTELIKFCIYEAYEKEFPVYKQEAFRRAQNTPEKKAISLVEKEMTKEKVRLELARQEKVNICNLLEGTVLTGDNGREVCQYTQYSHASPWQINERVVQDDLEILNDETPLLQYQGLSNERGPAGKAAIEATRAKIAALPNKT